MQGHSCLWLLDGKLCHLSALTPFRSNLFMYVSYSLVRTIYVHRLDIHTCSLEGGEGNICSPPLFTSPPSPPLLSCGCGCSCSVCRAQSTPLRSRRPLSPSVAIRNANASHLPHSRVAVAWGLPCDSFPVSTPVKLKVGKNSGNSRQSIYKRMM